MGKGWPGAASLLMSVDTSSPCPSCPSGPGWSCCYNQQPTAASLRNCPWDPAQADPMGIFSFQAGNPAGLRCPWQQVNPQAGMCCWVWGSRAGAEREESKAVQGPGFQSSGVMESSSGRRLEAWEDWHRGTSRMRQVVGSILAFGGARSEPSPGWECQKNQLIPRGE